MLVIRGYLDGNGVDANSFQSTTESLFEFDLENSDIMQITFAGAIVLIYVVNYIADQIPQITNKILSIFGVSQEDKLSKEMGENALNMVNAVINGAKEIVKIAKNPDAVSKDTKSDKGAEK